MDTSEQYIKMCEKAKEIQEAWNLQVGDWFLHDYHGTTGFGDLEDQIWQRKEDWVKIECLTHKPSIDDFIEVSEANGRHGVYTSASLFKDRHIWLPHQGQLQEMLEWKNLTTLLAEVLDFSCSPESYTNHPDPQIDFLVYKWDSMEQLWLAFVLWETEGKIWNGEDWGIAGQQLERASQTERATGSMGEPDG